MLVSQVLRKPTTVVAALLQLTALPLLAQTDAQIARIQTRLQGRLDSLHAGAKFPGATAGVALPNGKSIGLAVGYADSVARVRMTPAHRMLQGSVGKTYYAAVALQLVGEGKLDLDAPISKYLSKEPWWKDASGRTRLPNGDQIIVRNLMNHTSGVVRYEFKKEFLADLMKQPLREWTPAERLAYILDQQPPFAAGAGWEYSDTNYIILGIIIERITGSTLYEETRKRVLEPHLLRNTIPSDRVRLPGVAQGYAGPNNDFGGIDAMMVDGAFAVNPQLEWAGGGMASTAEDLARWARIVYEAKAFKPEQLAQAINGVEARMLGANARYGLGIIIRPTPLGQSLGHSGFFPGYLTEMRYYPDHKFAVAFQVNTSVGRSIGRNPGAVLQDLAAIVAEELSR